ncbi:hypothetical protein [Hyalangium versicolor]|uniref:hypothetical protein n=1 Tax=Hyalangium versicolor TaxID=2861190 RepID=UPI001CCEBB08|nr:hypothetical protein [Hyalangium versicolor]
MTTRYAVRFVPTFHPAAEIEVCFGPEGEYVRVRTHGHGERIALSTEQGVRFLDEMAALAPESIPDGKEMGFDGCTFTCTVQYPEGRKHVFSAWSPSREQSPQQHAFISLIYRAAEDAARRPEIVRVLKQLFGYFN